MQIQEQRRRSEQSQIQHAELQLGRVHDAGMAGEHCVQHHQQQRAEHEPIDGGGASRQHRLEKCRHAKRLADEKTKQSENRQARRQQANPRIVAMLPRDELMDGDGLVAAQRTVEKLEQRLAQDVDQIDTEPEEAEPMMAGQKSPVAPQAKSGPNAAIRSA